MTLLKLYSLEIITIEYIIILEIIKSVLIQICLTFWFLMDLVLQRISLCVALYFIVALTEEASASHLLRITYFLQP